jgi:putative SOS response-associated peptidase YedK
MCGRFVLTADLQAIQQSFDLLTLPAQFQPRYNIAPTQPVAVITNEKSRELTFYRWGLIPSWAKDDSMAARMINARSETAAEKPAFRSALRRRRCIIPADGFYEWQQHGKDKIPFFIHRQERQIFGMAGLWEIWQEPGGGEIRTCTILTTEANTFMKNYHERMPVILRREDYRLWLSPNEEPAGLLTGLMRPYAEDDLVAYPVSKAVNRPGNDSPELIRPLQ